MSTILKNTSRHYMLFRLTPGVRHIKVKVAFVIVGFSLINLIVPMAEAATLAIPFYTTSGAVNYWTADIEIAKRTAEQMTPERPVVYCNPNIGIYNFCGVRYVSDW